MKEEKEKVEFSFQRNAKNSLSRKLVLELSPLWSVCAPYWDSEDIPRTAASRNPTLLQSCVNYPRYLCNFERECDNIRKRTNVEAYRERNVIREIRPMPVPNTCYNVPRFAVGTLVISINQQRLRDKT